MKVFAGNRGDAVRSDCYVELSKHPGKPNEVYIKSKVKALYGNAIETLCLQMLEFFGMQNYVVSIEDSGALPFVIAARLEAAIKQAIETDKVWKPDILPENDYPIPRSDFRRSRLYLPGNNPKMMINAGIYVSDALILDLEDSVVPEKKTEAAILVRNALCQVNFYGAERMVRINQIPRGLKDLPYLVNYGVHTLVIPKCETPEDIVAVEREVERLGGKEIDLHFIPIIETALGVERAFEIATASQRVVALAIGLEDYTADIGASRSKSEKESFYARTRIVNAARAAGVQPLSSVVSDFENKKLLKKKAKAAKKLGFEGVGCIHPGQAQTVNEIFAPSDKELHKAQKIVLAFNAAQKAGSGVVSVDRKMVDAPVVKRAQATIENAIKLGLINEDWLAEILNA